MENVKRLLAYVRRYRWRYAMGVLALVLVDLLNAMIPNYTGQITDGVAGGGMTLAEVGRLVALILLMGLGIALGRFGWRYFLFGSARSIERDVRGDLFSHLETLDPGWFNYHKTGDLMAHFTNDLQTVREMTGMYVVTAVDATVMLAIVIVCMIRFVSLKLTLVAMIPLVLLIFGDYLFATVMHERFKEKQAAFSDLTDMTQEAISGIRVIKAFVQEKRELYAFRRQCLKNKEKNLRVVNLIALVYPLLDLVIGISTLMTLLYGGWLAILGEITIGQFVAFNSYVNMLVWPMLAVGECVTGISQGMASWGRIMAILRETAEITDSEADPTITTLKGHIALNDLTFTYPGSQTPALSHITVDVPAGSTLAIIGRTGSGKSTIISLIERLWDAEPGMITIDGYPLRRIPLKTLRTQLAAVPQDSFLFSDTISGNIAFARDTWEQSEIETAARDACVHDNIIAFPEGYETVVGERGVTLSGGQKQRTAIARALLCDAPVLLLDDALSAVDTDTEESIMQNLRRLRGGKTTIIVAHRVSTIQHADRILVLDDGRPVEYGTHEELMRLRGAYRAIWEKQQLELALSREGGDEA